MYFQCTLILQVIMKTLLTFFVLLFSTSVVANEFEWKKISTSITGTSIYADLSSIKKNNNNRVTFLELTDFFEPSEQGILSVIVYKEVNCKNFSFRYLKDIYFELPMGKGEEWGVNNEKSEWMGAIKDSVSHRVHIFVCDYKL